MPSGDFCCVAPRGGTPSMISATELVQITAPARSTGFVTFSGSLGSAKVFARSPTRLVMGASRAELRPAFLGRIACPTATTTAAHSRHPRATSTLLAETAGQRLHRELVLRFLREISPQESISARHKTTKRGRHGSPHAWAATKVPSCGPDPAIAARAANLRAVPPQKVGPVTVRGENPSYISESYKSYRVLV